MQNKVLIANYSKEKLFKFDVKKLLSLFFHQWWQFANFKTLIYEVISYEKCMSEKWNVVITWRKLNMQFGNFLWKENSKSINLLRCRKSFCNRELTPVSLTVNLHLIFVLLWRTYNFDSLSFNSLNNSSLDLK